MMNGFTADCPLGGTLGSGVRSGPSRAQCGVVEGSQGAQVSGTQGTGEGGLAGGGGREGGQGEEGEEG